MSAERPLRRYMVSRQVYISASVGKSILMQLSRVAVVTMRQLERLGSGSTLLIADSGICLEGREPCFLVGAGKEKVTRTLVP